MVAMLSAELLALLAISLVAHSVRGHSSQPARSFMSQLVRPMAMRSQRPAQNKLVRLIVVRHGQSCANIVEEYGSMLSRDRHKDYPDPLLSDCGVARTRAAARLLAHEAVDFVGSSRLLRAIETAWHQFGGRPVHVLPHIGEVGDATQADPSGGTAGEADNTPLAPQEQVEILRRVSPSIQADYSWLPEEAPKAASWTDFERFLATRLLPGLGIGGSDGVYTLGIVSHSNLIRRFLGQPPGEAVANSTGSDPPGHCFAAMPRRDGRATKPHNNQALEIFYWYDEARRQLAIDTSRPCRALGVSAGMPVGVPAGPRGICEADFTRCVGRFPASRSSASLLPGGRLGWSPKVSRGRLEASQCLTAHECAAGFPYVASAEQLWADRWRQALANKSLGAELPAYPDLSQLEVCECQAAAESEQPCSAE